MELWDIYDHDRNKAGKTIQAGTKLLDHEFRLVSHLCIFNSKNELLIQKRYPNKSLYPGLWDLSVSGSAQTGEISRAAAKREGKEELGLDLQLKDTRCSLTFKFDEGFDDFYLIISDINIENLELQSNELTNVAWARQEEILSMIEKESFLPYHSSVIQLLFYMKDDMRIHTQ